MKINEAKKLIYNFFKLQVNKAYPDLFPLTDNATNKIFWDRVKNVKPPKPYIVLNDTSINKLYKRYEHFVLDGKEYIRKEYRIIVTFGVYTLINNDNLAEADTLAIELIEFIQNLFTETQETFETLYNSGLTINELESSDIRDLSSFSSTNQEFRKEIDIAFEFDDIQEFVPDLGKSLDISIKVANKDITMEFTEEREENQ